MPPPTSKAEQFRARADDCLAAALRHRALWGWRSSAATKIVGNSENGQRVLITWLWIEWNSINSDASLPSLDRKIVSALFGRSLGPGSQMLEARWR